MSLKPSDIGKFLDYIKRKDNGEEKSQSWIANIYYGLSCFMNFLVEEDGIRPPLNSIAGLGNVAALNIQNAYQKEGKFMSVEEMKIRAGVGKSTIELLENAGCLKGMTLSNQMSLFTL